MTTTCRGGIAIIPITGKSIARLILAVALAFLLSVERGQAVHLISSPLEAVVKRVDFVCVGELLDAKTVFNHYEYGKGSRSWNETRMTFSVKQVLKGSSDAKTSSGTFFLSSFEEFDVPGTKEQECPVIDASGIETSLQKGETYIFLLVTLGDARTILRVEPLHMLETLQKILR